MCGPGRGLAFLERRRSLVPQPGRGVSSQRGKQERKMSCLGDNGDMDQLNPSRYHG